MCLCRRGGVKGRLCSLMWATLVNWKQTQMKATDTWLAPKPFKLIRLSLNPLPHKPPQPFFLTHHCTFNVRFVCLADVIVLVSKIFPFAFRKKMACI